MSDEASETGAEKRRPGRPRKNDEARLPIEAIDRLLVHGEVDERGATRFPSYRELAVRYGVVHSVIADYARRHNCMGRRKQAIRDVRELADQQVIAARAERLATDKQALLGILDSYFGAFAEALREGRVKCDSLGDFNTACRLQAFLLGDAESRREVVQGISLEELQLRHTEMLERLADATPAMRGVVVALPVATDASGAPESGGEMEDAYPDDAGDCDDDDPGDEPGASGDPWGAA